MDGGATLLQLRAKHMSSREFLEVADTVTERARASQASVIINDRADVARLAGAAGVHVGQDDVSPADVRRVVGNQAIVGLSTHTEAQYMAAAGEPIDYLAVGPVFSTTTKDTGYTAVGIDLVRGACEAARGRSLPVIAIGGITLERAESVIRAGAASVAVITDLLVDEDPSARVRTYLDRLSRV
jgi:thiamine-phosphate pyrophosphorylase